MNIIYKKNNIPDIEQIIALYKSSGLNRPIADKKRINRMFANSNIIITA